MSLITDKKKLSVHLVAGARPNFMKIAPLWHVLVKESWCQPVLVHTGQHFDENMSGSFFADLNLPEADYYLDAGSGTHAVQTAQIMVAYEQVCIRNPPDWVVVAGDVNSTLAAAVVAKKLCLPVAHLEAGLRSGDHSMPEELNRLMTDAIADLLWTPSLDADENLIREGISPNRIEFVGNIMIDALEMLREKIESVEVDSFCELTGEAYGLVTIHRPSNVDTRGELESIVNALVEVSKELPLVFPIHPRTLSSLHSFGIHSRLANARVSVMEPLNYIKFMALLMRSRLAITDSGGIQEETSYLGIPCYTLRSSTERPITLKKGTNRLIEVKNLPSAILERKQYNQSPIDFWDGCTALRVARSLRRHAFS